MEKEVKLKSEIKKKKTNSKPQAVKVKKTTKTKKEANKKKSFADKIMSFIQQNLYDVIFAMLSIIAVIIGSFAIGLIKSIIIVLVIDVLVWFLPVISFIGNKTKRKFKRRTFVQIILWCMIGGLSACIAFTTFIVIKAPAFDPNNLYSKEATVIYDKDGKIVTKIGNQMREKITYEDLPQVLIDAIVATEDSQFFQHNGFNPLRFLKASFNQVIGSGGGGASTITMQVSKNAFTSFDASGINGIIRKFTDIYLSIFKIEKTYTKEEILEFYVNSYYMGGSAWGVEQACQNYFGKSVSEINLSEAALIAALFKGGYSYDPFLFPENAESRRKEVLYLMQRHGYITEEENEIAKKLTVDEIIVNKGKTESYQSFIDTVVEEVKKKTKQDPYSVPMEIYTTMDPKKQEHINKIMSGEAYKWENDVVQAGIAVTDTNTGAIVAIGAGRNRTGALTQNYATMINRQIGSTAKPLYDYGPAIEYNNLAPSQPITDEPYAYSSGLSIKNWDKKYEGLTTIREALKSSRNIPALKSFQATKNNNIKTFVTKLGLHPEIENGTIFESHSLGGYTGENPLSMAAAYAAFANGGTYIEPYSFTKIIFRETNEEFINTYETTKVMSPSTAYLVTDILLDTAVYTTGSNRVNGVQYTNKTGTTNFDEKTIKDYNLPSNVLNDLWCAGYSRDFAVALWYGYDKISSEYYTLRKSQHTSLYKAVIKGIYTGTKNFTKPSGIVEVVIEKDNEEIKLPSEYTPEEYKVTEYFKAGTEPTEVSTRFAQLADPTNLSITEQDSNIILNWDHIAQPNELNEQYLTNTFSSLFTNKEQLATFVTERLTENNTLLGTIEYEIYRKDENGNLSLLGITVENTFTFTPDLTNNIVNIVIKATYSNFKANASKGAEAGTTINIINSTITSNINGAAEITINVGTPYEEPINPILVWENLIDDVTHQSNISKVITNANGDVVDNIDTNTPGSYTITYKIQYKNHTNTLKKTITIQ